MIAESKKIEIGAWYWVEWVHEARRAQVFAADERRIVMWTPWRGGTWIFEAKEVIAPAEAPPVAWWQRLFGKRSPRK